MRTHNEIKLNDKLNLIKALVTEALVPDHIDNEYARGYEQGQVHLATRINKVIES